MRSGVRGVDESRVKDLIRRLVSIPSSANDGNEIYEFVFDLLGKECPGKTWYGQRSRYLEYQGFRNVYSRIGSGEGPRIMLNCHLDTVNPGEGWFHPPYSAGEEGGRIYGLGAADMKGGAAAAIAAFMEISKMADKVRGELVLSCVFGEEAPYSLGTDTLFSDIDISDHDLIIIPEPSPLLAINDHCVVHQRIHRSKFPVVIVGAEGRVLFEVEFQGKASHASHPSQGINALHDASKLITELTRFDLFSHIKMGRGHYVVLNIDGGNQSFTVPSSCKLLINRQLTLGETEDSVQKELKTIVSSLKLKSKVLISKRYSPSPDLEYNPYIFESSKYLDKFVQKVMGATSKGRKRPCLFTTSSVGDFNLFGARAKVPTVVFGPGGGNIHSPNEFVNISEVVATSNLIHDFLMEAFELG
ncbi:MAG: M20 family metallopeptidase [Thermoplasmatota archaeon]